MKKTVKKKFIAFLIGIILLFNTSPLLEAKEKEFHIGISTGICGWPSNVFKYMRVYPQDIFWNVYGKMNILDQEIKLKTLFNLNFQYRLSPRLGLQGEISHQEANYKASFALIPYFGRVAYPSHSLSWSVSTVSINAIFEVRKPEARIFTFGFIGLGFCFVGGDEDQVENYKIEIRSALDLSMKVGVGVAFNLAPQTLPLGFTLRAFIQVLGATPYSYYSPYYGRSDIEIGGYNLIWGIDLGLRYRL